MKTIRAITLIVVIVFFGGKFFGQTMTLINLSQGHVYFGTVPISDQQYRGLLDNPGQFKGMVVQDFNQLQSIAPGAMKQNIPAFQNDTLVYGIVLFPGREGAPVFQFRVLSSGLNQSYAINQNSFIPGSGEERFLSLSSFELPRNLSPLVIDRRFVDWLHMPDVRRFTATFVPSQILQRTDDAAVLINPNQSAFWQKGGVQLERVKAAITNGSFYFMISSFQTISRGSRFIIRYYPDENLPNSGSIEVSVRDIGGPVFLWRTNSSEPIIAGQFAAANFSLEAEVGIDFLKEYLGYDANHANAIWEISSAAAEAGVYEEFYYGYFPQREIHHLGR